MKIVVAILGLLAIACLVLDWKSERDARSPDEYTPIFYVVGVALGIADLLAALIYVVVR